MQFVSIEQSYLVPATIWVYGILGYAPFNAENTEKAKLDVRNVLSILDKYLAYRTYLVGNRVTLADIIGVCSLLQFYSLVLDPPFRQPYLNVNRWFETCVNQPQFKAVIGEFRFCEKMAVYEPPKASKKETIVTPASAASQQDDEEDEFEEKPKGKNPLDLLPPSSFNLDTWKRFYSNNKIRPDALDYFWKNFDKQGFSIYNVEYKYNRELTKLFMTANLIGGFFQRLEAARKYAFGSVCVVGEDNNNQISGYFVFRGPGIPKEVSESPDFDSYVWTRVDPDNTEARKEFDMYLAKDCPGFAEGKIFK
jgi:elongation factor 1-gamma